VRASFETPAKFVTWGRCDPVKNLDHIADCVHEFNELRGTHTRIVVVGSPSGKEARDWWASVIERDNNRARPVIIWKPGVPQTEMGSLVDHASAFLHASSTGFDKAALEAASLGIPVLSTSDPIRTALGGLPSRSDLVAQLTYWADLPALERAKFAGAQQALVNDSHSLSHLADSLSEVLYPWKSK
jgi:glycosyltransferase involved in cell wall biosynthesis